MGRPPGPTRHVTSLKTTWKTVPANAKVKGRCHDNRVSLIMEFAESGAGDETIMESLALWTIRCFFTTVTSG